MIKKLKSYIEKNKQIKKINNSLKKLNLSKNKYNAIELMLVFIMALVFGVLVGEMIFSGTNLEATTITDKTDNYLSEIKNVYNTITKEYINEINKEELKNVAIDAMMSSLGDSYSNFYNEEESNNFEEELSGTFYGMGSEIYQEKGKIIVNRVFEGSPAEKAGLKKGDIYLKLNDKNIEKKSIDEISKLIKGNKSKTFTLTVKRGQEEKIIKIKTGKVDIPSVESKIIEKENKKIGYIQIGIFANNTDEQFEKKLKEIEKENIKNLIIDLRSNQGGELGTVVNIASNFLSKKEVVVQTVKDKKVTKIYSNKNGKKGYKIVVLINSSSASGSEVLAGALNENYNAKLIGTTTFGKGTVQQTKKLSNGTMIKYTTETWRTSKGKEINKKGINPTIKIELNKKYYQTKNEKDDNQLNKAIEVLLKE